MQKNYIKVEDLANINQPEENKIYAIIGNNQPRKRRAWADLDLKEFRVQVFKDSFTCKLKLPKNTSRKDYYVCVSAFAQFLRRMGKYMYNNQVLNAQTKEEADQAMAAAWRNYVDAWFEMQRKYEQQFLAQQEEAPQEGLQINENIELL
jgi:hypothetical protein